MFIAKGIISIIEQKTFKQGHKYKAWFVITVPIQPYVVHSLLYCASLEAGGCLKS